MNKKIRVMKKIAVWFWWLAIAIVISNFFVLSVEAKSPDNNISTIQKMKSQLALRTNNTLVNGAMPSKGNVKTLVINIVQSGVENEKSTEEVYTELFGDHYSYESSARDENLIDYYEKESNGKLHISGEVVEYSIDENFSEYKKNENSIKDILDFVYESKDMSEYDSNDDGFIDSVVIFTPDNYNETRGCVENCDYEINGCKLIQYIILTQGYKNVCTVAHEIVHTMGTPDIYANVSVNKAGTYADTILDGTESRWNSDDGNRHTSIPGIIKFLFGWSDEVLEIDEVGEYTLRSFMDTGNIAVIYPEKNICSRFIFVVEYLKEDRVNTDKSGLRVWRILLNIDDAGNIIGNENCYGCGSSPYDYIEALNDGNVTFFYENDFLSNTSIPNTKYFNSVSYGEYYADGTVYNAAIPDEEFDSDIILYNIKIDSDTASFSIADKSVSEDLPRCILGYHSFSGYYANETTDKHYQICTECGIHSAEENHNYVLEIDGTLHRCDACGAVGNHDFSKCISNEDGTHRIICQSCDAVWEGHDKDACSGGIATCKAKAICSECGVEYGSLADHEYGTTWKSDGTNHWHICIVCGAKKDIEAHTLKTTTTKATFTANGKKETKCSVCGKKTKKETIYAAKTIKLSDTKYTYNGKAKKPSVIVKDSKGDTIANTYYTVTYPSGRKNVGKYTVKVTFKGNYSGSKNLTFKINPPKTSISSVAAGSKAFTVKWAKKTTQVTGYEIQYSASSTFAGGNKIIKVTSAKNASKTIKSLKAKKKYYVRVRTYKTVNKIKYCSDWSAKKSVTTKQ